MSYAQQPPRVDPRIAAGLHRADRISGLKTLVSLLQAHPGVPAPQTVTVPVVADDDLAGAERVRLIAARVGGRYSQAPDGTCRAVLRIDGLTLAYVYVPTTDATSRGVR